MSTHIWFLLGIAVGMLLERGFMWMVRQCDEYTKRIDSNDEW